MVFFRQKQKADGKRRQRNAFGRLIASRSGVSAVEFALVAAPFFALLLAIFELGYISLAQEVLQTATTNSARLIMTGSAQSQNMTPTQFQQDVCANAAAMIDCSRLYVNVQNTGSFGGVSMVNPLTNAGNFNQAVLNYSPGNPGDIVLVQVFYECPIELGPLNLNFTNMSGQQRLLIATAVFRNEPYGLLH